MAYFFGLNQTPVTGGGGGSTLPVVSSGLLMFIEPADLSTCYKDTARTLPASVGDVVKGVADKSGHNNHWSQSTTGNAPTAVSLSGKNALDFGTDGNHYMFFASPLTTIRTAFWVVREAPGYAGGYQCLLGDASVYDFHGGNPHACWFSAANIASTRIDKVETAVLAAQRPTSLKVVSAITNSNSSASEFSRDRVNTYGARSWCGEIMLLMAYSSVLTAGQISGTEDAIKAKYSI